MLRHAFSAALTKTCFLVSRLYSVVMHFTAAIAVGRRFYVVPRVLNYGVGKERNLLYS